MPATAQAGKENWQNLQRAGRKGPHKPPLAVNAAGTKEPGTPWAQIVRQGRRAGAEASGETPGLATSLLQAVALQTPGGEQGPSCSSAAAETPTNDTCGGAATGDDTALAAAHADAGRDSVACPIVPTECSAALNEPCISPAALSAAPSKASSLSSRSASPQLEARSASPSDHAPGASRMVTAADILREGGVLDSSPDIVDVAGAPTAGPTYREAAPEPVDAGAPHLDEAAADLVDRPQTPPVPRNLLFSPSKRQNDVRSPPADQRVAASKHAQADASRPSYKKPRSEHLDGCADQRPVRQPALQQRPQQQPRQPKRQPAGSSAGALRKGGVCFDFSRHDGYQPLAEDALAVLDSSCNSFVKREIKRAAAMDRPACELTAQLQAAVSATWPGAIVICFGSRATGLAGAASDVDLVVVGVKDLANDPHPTVEAQLQALKKLLPRLEALPVKASIQKSSVPIIALEVTEGTAAGLKVDLSLHSLRHSGIMAAQNICWLQAGLPALQPLTLILKELLRLHDLKSTYTGGLSSYALTNMVALFLLLSPMVRAERAADAAAAKGAAPPTALPPSPSGSPVALATLLLELLHFYGCLFDPAAHALAWDRGVHDEPVVVIGRRHSSGALAVHEHAPLLIFDALDATNNVGKCCYRFSLIQKVFRCAAAAGRAAATAAAESACKGVPPDAEGIVTAMLAAADGASAARAACEANTASTEVK